MVAPVGPGVPGRIKGRSAEEGKGLGVLQDDVEVHQDLWGAGSMAL